MDILSAERRHIKFISEFQVDMANETESLKLDPLNTEKGVTAIFDDPSKGEYLICEIEGKTAKFYRILRMFVDSGGGGHRAPIGRGGSPLLR